jgi:hypothetical protein
MICYKNKNISIALGLSIIIVLAIILWPYFYKFNGVLSNQSSDWGNFGDYVGGTAGPALSVISTIVIIFAFLYQKREFENSINYQIKIIENQKIESTLLNLEKIQNRISYLLDKEIVCDELQYRNVKLHFYFKEYAFSPIDVPENNYNFDTAIFRQLVKLLKLEVEQLNKLKEYDQKNVLYQIYNDIEHESILKYLIKLKY